MTPFTPRFYTFWSLEGSADSQSKRTRLESYLTSGFDGVVLDPKDLGSESLAQLSETILEAKRIGLRVWLSSKSNVTFLSSPEHVPTRLTLLPDPQDDALVSCRTYADESDATGQKWYITPKQVNGLDTLRIEPGAFRLNSVLEGYRKGLSPEAFEYVEAIFSASAPREIGLAAKPAPSIPWSHEVWNRFKERFGEEAEARVPLLFFEGPGSEESRLAYWDLVGDIASAAYFEIHRDWCVKQNKLFVGLVRNEGALPLLNFCSQMRKGGLVSGTNAPGRYLPFFARLSASAAAQFGEGRCAAECGGVDTWGASPDDFERSLLWLTRNGTTDLVLYPGRYDAYSDTLNSVRRAIERKPPQPATTLVIAPIRGMMAEHDPKDTSFSVICRRLNEKLERLHAQGTPFHLCDERTLEEMGGVSSQGIKLGKCVYQDVVISSDALLSKKGMDVLQGLSEPGQSPLGS